MPAITKQAVASVIHDRDVVNDAIVIEEGWAEAIFLSHSFFCGPFAKTVEFELNFDFVILDALESFTMGRMKCENNRLWSSL